MSELTRQDNDYGTLRRHLLTTVSAFALAAMVLKAADAMAAEDSRPTVWIDLGGQLERVDGGEEAFAPPFILADPQPAVATISPLSAQHPARYSIGGEANLTVTPQNSNWVFSASVRYGRSSASKHIHQQSYPVGYPETLFGQFAKSIEPLAGQFRDTKTQNSEAHAIVDFSVGKDVGLGLFGRNGSSSVNVGVRFAQFTSSSRTTLRENPDWHFTHKYLTIPSYGLYHFKLPYGQPYHSFSGAFSATRSFRGVGPSLSWKNSTTIAGNDDGAIAVDWGVNGAILFGRQKAQTHHQTTGQYHPASGFIPHPAQRTTLYQNPATPDHTRSRSVIVPNVGGFAGLSFRYDAAKVSFGYRADFFFGAMDGGIDTRETYDRNFYGPFATISIGLGG